MGIGSENGKGSAGARAEGEVHGRTEIVDHRSKPARSRITMS